MVEFLSEQVETLKEIDTLLMETKLAFKEA
jgi:hypothetical protein